VQEGCGGGVDFGGVAMVLSEAAWSARGDGRRAAGRLGVGSVRGTVLGMRQEGRVRRKLGWDYDGFSGLWDGFSGVGRPFRECSKKNHKKAMRYRGNPVVSEGKREKKRGGEKDRIKVISPMRASHDDADGEPLRFEMAIVVVILGA